MAKQYDMQCVGVAVEDWIRSFGKVSPTAISYISRLVSHDAEMEIKGPKLEVNRMYTVRVEAYKET